MSLAHETLQVAHDPRCSKSGVYWSWNGGPREGRGEEALEKDGQILGGGGAGGGWDSIYENDQALHGAPTSRGGWLLLAAAGGWRLLAVGGCW